MSHTNCLYVDPLLRKSMKFNSSSMKNRGNISLKQTKFKVSQQLLVCRPSVTNFIKICQVVLGMKHVDRHDLPIMHFMQRIYM